MIPLAGPANKQGRIVANNIYNREETYHGTLGTSVVKVFDLTVATTGLNEKILRNKDLTYKVLHIHPMSHAAYYPGATPLSLKVIFNPETGRIYGAQAIGESGVEKRIDVIATAISGQLTVFDLADLELSYAPPYSSAKDPVNMAGYVAENIVKDGIETIQWHGGDQLVKEGGMIIDVRGAEGHTSAPQSRGPVVRRPEAHTKEHHTPCNLVFRV